MFTKIIHDKFVYSRRMDLLSGIISKHLNDGEKILDIGCGDGKIDWYIMQKKNVNISGVDILVRDTTYIPVQKYDGTHLPFADNDFDVVLFVDVLHHIDNPFSILQEAKRVAKSIIIKDHLREGLFAYSTLKFMDYVGNSHYGVHLPYNYLNKTEWVTLFNKVGLIREGKDEYETKLNLYSFPFSLFFDRKLHFCAKLHRI
jgi:2-polyprenyl-3-methyl-5-hydroxy-6-metoxy-1,4-benzoquinol methylase